MDNDKPVTHNREFALATSDVAEKQINNSTSKPSANSGIDKDFDVDLFLCPQGLGFVFELARQDNALYYWMLLRMLLRIGCTRLHPLTTVYCTRLVPYSAPVYQLFADFRGALHCIRHVHFLQNFNDYFVMPCVAWLTTPIISNDSQNVAILQHTNQLLDAALFEADH